MRRPRLRIWGGALEFSDLDPVSEEQIVLPGDLKASHLPLPAATPILPS